MSDLVRLVLLACEAQYPIGLLVVAVRGFALWVTDRLRVTDWLGYIGLCLFLVAAPLQL